MKIPLTIEAKEALHFSAPDFHPAFIDGDDFWRMFLDYCEDGKKRELCVYSHRQKAKSILYTASEAIYEYDCLIAEDGTEYKIDLTLNIKGADGEIEFSFLIQNHSSLRVNELQYPLFQFSGKNNSFSEDTLYIPEGLGRRIPNPHAYASRFHTEYMASDHKGVLKMYSYPGELSMPWMALENGKEAFYLGIHQKVFKKQSFLIGCEARKAEKPYFLLGIASYPAVCTGETVRYEGFTCTLFDGGWRSCARHYRLWADKNWLTVSPKKESVKRLNGWQRIILKHQFGKIYHTYHELPNIFREGKKYGIDMLLVFGWWKEGMDSGYPNYEPDDALGGAQALKAAIDEINQDGGRVVLYANGHLIDKATEYYKSCGYQYTMKDIELNDYHEHYMFSGEGTLLKMGYKTFVTGCYGTKEWKEKILEIERRHLALGSNGTFFDQLGCAFSLCFDSAHTHGKRIDLDPQLRLDAITDMKSLLSGDEWFGTEWVIDRISPLMDFTHGCGCGYFYEKGAYPYIFRYAFPEILTSNRFLHDDKEGFKKHLNYAFVFGLLFDVAIFRCRGIIADLPEYANHVKALNDLRDQYRDYFILGTFDLPDFDIQSDVWAAKYTYEGKSITAVFNDSNDDLSFIERNRCEKTIRPGEVCVLKL